jgi:deoxyuridine 5'-triphosphate nucleotidohydrolase
MNIKLLTPTARVPTRADPGSAGYDLYCDEFYVMLDPGERKLISTGISVSFESDKYLRIAPRSSMSLKGCDIGAGVIDSSYRGEIKVLLVNNSRQPYTFSRDDRIAQLILENCHPIEFVVVNELEISERGAGGFGSSGK